MRPDNRIRFLIISVAVTTFAFVLSASAGFITGIHKTNLVGILQELPVVILLVILSFFLIMYGLYPIAYILNYIKNNDNPDRIRVEMTLSTNIILPFISMMILVSVASFIVLAVVVTIIEQRTTLDINRYSNIVGLFFLIIAIVYLNYSVKTIRKYSKNAHEFTLSKAFKIKAFRFLRGAALLILVILIVLNVVMAIFLTIGKYDKHFISLHLLYMNILSTIAYAVAFLYLNRKLKAVSAE